MDINSYYMECECCSGDHVIRFIFDEDNNEVYTEIQLYQYHNIFQRLWLATKYVFGYTPKCGYYDCTILNSDKIADLVDLLIKYQNTPKP